MLTCTHTCETVRQLMNTPTIPTAFFVLLVIHLSAHIAPPQVTTNMLLLFLIGAAVLYKRLSNGSCVCLISPPVIISRLILNQCRSKVHFLFVLL